MSDLRIPPREDFNVSHQVYEWLRALSTAIQSLNDDDKSEAINALLGLFKSLEEDFNNLNNLLDNKEIENAQFKKILNDVEQLKADVDRDNLLESKLKKALTEIDRLKNELDTNEIINAKIKQLEESIALLPEESELSLFKAFNGLKVLTSEFKGTIAASTFFVDVAVPEIIGNAEVFVEATSIVSESADITSEILTPFFVRLSRNYATDAADYVIKLKEYRN